MTREQIEARIRALEKMHATERDCSTLATINRCLERLIMMDSPNLESRLRSALDTLEHVAYVLESHAETMPAHLPAARKCRVEAEGIRKELASNP